jgi:hypothetical protein
MLAEHHPDLIWSRGFVSAVDGRLNFLRRFLPYYVEREPVERVIVLDRRAGVGNSRRISHAPASWYRGLLGQLGLTSSLYDRLKAGRTSEIWPVGVGISGHRVYASVADADADLSQAILEEAREVANGHQR